MHDAPLLHSTLRIRAEEKCDEEKKAKNSTEANLHLPAEVGKWNALVRIERRDQQIVHELTNQDTEGDRQLEGRAHSSFLGRHSTMVPFTLSSTIALLYIGHTAEEKPMAKPRIALVVSIYQ